VDVAPVSDGLYGPLLEEFIPNRSDRLKQGQVRWRQDLAAQIHQLAKPNLVAWLANQLARERGNEIRPLLRPGVFVLVQQARRLAAATGCKVSQDSAPGLEVACAIGRTDLAG
jgi:hypothetical protein